MADRENLATVKEEELQETPIRIYLIRDRTGINKELNKITEEMASMMEKLNRNMFMRQDLPCRKKPMFIRHCGDKCFLILYFSLILNFLICL